MYNQICSKLSSYLTTKALKHIVKVDSKAPACSGGVVDVQNDRHV